MRAGLGIAGLLITIGVIAWIMYAVELPHTQSAISAGKAAEQQLAPLSSQGVQRFDASIDLDLQESGGKTNSILVTKIVPGGPAAIHFGLMKGDSIVEIGPFAVRDSIHSRGEARDSLVDAYQRQQTIIVIRNDERITLPPAGGVSKAAPANGAGTSGQSSDSVQQQLDAIKGMPGR